MVGTPRDEGFRMMRGFVSSISDRRDRRDGDTGFAGFAGLGGSFFGCCGCTGGKVTCLNSAYSRN